MSKEVLVYGSRTLGEMLLLDAHHHPDFNIVAFVVDKDYLNESGVFMGLPQVAFEEVERLFPPDKFDMIVLTASYNQMRYRDAMYNKAIAKGYTLRNYISPSAIVSSGITMGDNNVIFEMAFLGANGHMGSSNTIRQLVYIGHHFKFGDKNVFTPKATIGGCCQIASNCYIGINATILNRKSIGEEALIGGGAVVIKDIDPYTKNVGNPSRCIGAHREKGLQVILNEKNHR